MLRRLYVHNYKCFQNFSFEPSGLHSALLIGKNGTGKSTIMDVLCVLQKIGQGEHRVEEIFSKEFLTLWKDKNELHIEIEVSINRQKYTYAIAFDMPEGFSRFRIISEKLSVDDVAVLKRELASAILNDKAVFGMNWHYISLPLIFENEENKPLGIFKNWLANMLLLAPIPSLMSDISNKEEKYLLKDCSNFGGYLLKELGKDFSLFEEVKKNVKSFVEDFSAIKAKELSENSTQVMVYFDKLKEPIRFSHLSDGEKMFILHSFLLAKEKNTADLFVFWDEPDNFLARQEIQTFIGMLRAHFKNSNQAILTTHNTQTALRFSRENTFIMERRSHTMPTTMKKALSDDDFDDALDDLQLHGVDDE